MKKHKKNIKKRIYKLAVTVFGTAFFIGAFAFCGRIETEDIMNPTYETVGKVINNEYLNRNNWIVSVEVNGETYTYYSKTPQKLLSNVRMEMNNKKTLNLKDDEIIDILDVY